MGGNRVELEVTLDLAERRQIRTAIRELRRKELELCEEALASKRFRSERSREQEDKENQPRAEREQEQQQRVLRTLAGKLQGISDVEELTALLRGASEYEERKLIRAAIRKVRTDEIEAASLAGMLVTCSRDGDSGTLLSKGQEGVGDLSSSVAREREDLRERQTIKAQIQELRSTPNRGNHPTELTLGLTASPFRINSTSSGVSTSSAVETELPEQPAQQLEMFLPISVDKAELEKKGKLTAEELSVIEEEDILDKMLDKTTDFEERRLIRTAMRELRQRKRDLREKEREQRMQELKNKEREARSGRSTETSVRQSETSSHGSAISTVTKTQSLMQSNDGSKTSRTTTMEASYMKRSENGGTIVQTKSSFSATSKKVGSIFDREDEGLKRANSLRQAERKKELMMAQSLPKTPATQSRKAMIEKLEKESASSSSPAFAKVATPRSSAFGVPNANSIKQMLLDWCKAKTRGYEEARRLSTVARRGGYGPYEGAGLEVCLHVHPGVLPLPGAERDGKNQKVLGLLPR
ncbi:hypothetical protein FKM82_030945 [Ascaphus truei]